jgi:hypothetical protein
MNDEGGRKMHDVLVLLGILGAWILLQGVVLPRLGFRT